MVIVSPVYERDRSGRRYNTAAVIDADGELSRQVPQDPHPQDRGSYDEKYYFADGDLGYPVFDTAVGKVGVYICYDRHFPEGWRALALERRRAGVQPLGDLQGPQRSHLEPGAGGRRHRQRHLHRHQQPRRHRAQLSATTCSTAPATSATRAGRY